MIGMVCVLLQPSDICYFSHEFIVDFHKSSYKPPINTEQRRETITNKSIQTVTASDCKERGSLAFLDEIASLMFTKAAQ